MTVSARRLHSLPQPGSYIGGDICSPLPELSSAPVPLCPITTPPEFSTPFSSIGRTPIHPSSNPLQMFHSVQIPNPRKLGSTPFEFRSTPLEFSTTPPDISPAQLNPSPF
ncbi:unnamed protein product [Arctogadus glacialis]